MQLFGINIGKKADTDNAQARKPVADIKKQLNQLLKLAGRYETSLVALIVAVLLTITSLRMLHYMDPPVDDSKVQDSLSKSTKVRIDPKIVQRINQLQETGTTTTPSVETNRTNPFTE
jgi:hypothetical protein